MKVVIIGAGLAGMAAGYVLGQAGLDVTIYEASDTIAPGASGNALGLYNPRIAAHRTPESDFYTSAFALALRIFPMLDDVDWDPCGALHLIVDEKKAKRYPQTTENWGWPEEELRVVSPDEASDIAGVSISHEAMYISQSGVVSPKKLCHAYATGIDINLNSKIESLDGIEADIIIIAAGMGAQAFEETARLPLQPVRGQITEVQAWEHSAKLKTNLCYGGYFLRAQNGAHMLGSTFQRWLDHDDEQAEDNDYNLKSLAAAVPGLEQGLEVTGQRAAVRTTTKDHFPIVGPVPRQDNLYVSVGHGSHGILTSLAGAHLLADMILKRPLSQSMATTACLSPARFCDTQSL